MALLPVFLHRRLTPRPSQGTRSETHAHGSSEETEEEGGRDDDEKRDCGFGFAGLATIEDVADELDSQWDDDTSAAAQTEVGKLTHTPLPDLTSSRMRSAPSGSRQRRFHGAAPARRSQSFSPSSCVSNPISASFHPVFFRNLRLPAYSVISRPPSPAPASPAPSHLSASSSASSATSAPIIRHRSAHSPSASSSCSSSTCASPISTVPLIPPPPEAAGFAPPPRQVDCREIDSPWRALLFKICGCQSALLQRRQHVFIMRNAERLDSADPRWAQREPNNRPWDPPLSEWGRYQAYQVGVRLRQEGWGATRVVCAPYVRCAETAAEVICAMSSSPDMDYVPTGPGYGCSSSPCLPLPCIGRSGSMGCRTVGLQQHIIRTMQEPLTPAEALQHRKRKHAARDNPVGLKADEPASSVHGWQAGMPVPLSLVRACIDYSLCEVVQPGTARPRLSHVLAGRAALEALLPAECVERVGWEVTGGADLRVPRGPEQVERAAMRLVTAMDRIAEQWPEENIIIVCDAESLHASVLRCQNKANVYNILMAAFVHLQRNVYQDRDDEEERGVGEWQLATRSGMSGVYFT